MDAMGRLKRYSKKPNLSMNTHANEFQFGDLAGTTNIDMRASGQRKGGRVSYASSNRSYQGRVMGSYNSGIAFRRLVLFSFDVKTFWR